MITIFDMNHVFVGVTATYKDACIETAVDTGDKTLSFTYYKAKGSADIPLVCHYHKYDEAHKTETDEYVDFNVSVAFGNFPIECEYYLQYEGDEYIVKQVSGDGLTGLKVTAILNLEWLHARFFKDYTPRYTNISAGGEVMYYLYIPYNQGSGHSKGGATIGPPFDDAKMIIHDFGTDRIDFGIAEGDTLDVIKACCATYMLEPVFDTINRKVYLYNRLGEDTGVEFRRGFNLKAIKKTIDSFDFYTVIYPEGKNGLHITNPDVEPKTLYKDTRDVKTYSNISSSDYTVHEHAYAPKYESGFQNTDDYYIPDTVVCDFTYSDKTRIYYWHDENYTDPALMLEDAKKLLADMSRPIVSYEIKASDLTLVNSDFQSYAFKLGDTILVADPLTGTYEKQRIIAMKTYPQDHDKDTLTLANTTLTWRQIQAKLQTAQKFIEQSTKNGKIMLSAISDLGVTNDEITPESGFTVYAQKVQKQLNTVTVDITMQGTFNANTEYVVGTLPEGYRPSSEKKTGMGWSSATGNPMLYGIFKPDGKVIFCPGNSSATWMSAQATFFTA